jgi:hypothetical protein
VRLDVGILRAEELLRALDGEVLGDVDERAAAVIALARIALGVLVGERRALRRQHRHARVILRGDQLDMLLLALIFLPDGVPHLGV